MSKSRIQIPFALLLTFLFFVCSGLSAQNKLNTAGKKEGPWKGTYEDGKLRYVGQFQSGIPVDTFYYYYPQGELKSTLIWTSPNESFAIMYYATGEKMAEGKYLDQQKTGKWVTYGAKEVKVNEGNYIAGKKYELWRTFYRNGKVSEEVSFVADLENGSYKSYYEDGSIQSETTYKDGYRQGKVSVYFLSGQVKIVGQFVKDVRDGIWAFYKEDGELYREVEFDLGKRITPAFEDEILESNEKFKDKVKDELDFEDMDGTIRYDEQRK